MRFALLLLAASLAAPSVSATSDSPASAVCLWTVSGNVRVAHALPELIESLGDHSDLVGVKVKVSARLRLSNIAGNAVWGTWDKWDETTTNSSGAYSVRHTPTLSPCDGVRQFRVEVKFQSDDLELRYENATTDPITNVKWYTIAEQSGNQVQTDHTVDFGTKTFDWQHANDLGGMEPRAHAEMWVVYNALIDQLESYGSAYGFTEQLVVKYPHNSWVAGDGAEASYANPITNHVYIFRANDCPPNRLIPDEDACESHFALNTLLHEAMHTWAYEHATGEDDLALNLLTSGSTHCFEPSHIAFHEGFAEFAAERLAKILFDVEAPLPVTREAMQSGFSCEGNTQRLTTMGQVETHDYGWITSLRTLIKGNLQAWTYEGDATSTCFRRGGNRCTGGLANEITETGTLIRVGSCESPRIVFKDVLTTFMANPAKGYPSPINNAGLNLEDFVDRLTDVHDLGNDTRDALLSLMDPEATEQPLDLFCEAQPGIRVDRPDGAPRSLPTTQRTTRRRRGN